MYFLHVMQYRQFRQTVLRYTIYVCYTIYISCTAYADFALLRPKLVKKYLICCIINIICKYKYGDTYTRTCVCIIMHLSGCAPVCQK